MEYEDDIPILDVPTANILPTPKSKPAPPAKAPIPAAEILSLAEQSLVLAATIRNMCSPNTPLTDRLWTWIEGTLSEDSPLRDGVQVEGHPTTKQEQRLYSVSTLAEAAGLFAVLGDGKKANVVRTFVKEMGVEDVGVVQGEFMGVIMGAGGQG